MYILENIKDGLGNRIYCIINILYDLLIVRPECLVKILQFEKLKEILRFFK